MAEIWRKIKDFPNHRVSNKGRIKNIKLNKLLSPARTGPHSKLLYIELTYKGKSQVFGIHKLVAKTFKRMSETDESAIHLNYVQFDNRAPNLEGSTRGEALVRTRRHNRIKTNKLLGVYKWNQKGCSKTWRAVLSLGNGKMGVKTIGYYYTRKAAKLALYSAYTERFGQEPFKL